MKASYKIRLATGTATLFAAALLGGAAHAQSAQAVEPGADAAQDASTAAVTPPAADAPAADAGIADIVVTAQRRSETLQRSSLAIDVVSGPELQAVTNPVALTTVVPTIQVATSANNLQVYIRGIGDTGPNGRAQSAVAASVDGVYIQQGSAVGPMMFDIARIEILKGPQGTLYGRNASGGAINIITNRPELGQVSGYVSGNVGNYDLFSGAGAINIPIGDTIAIRAAAQGISRDGYNSDGGSDQKMVSGRLRTLWQPDPAISFLLTLEGAHVGGTGFGNVVLPRTNGEDPWTGIRDPIYDPYTSYISTDGLDTPISGAQSNDGFIDNDIRNISLEASWDMGPVTLTVIPTHQYQSLEFVTYGDFRNQNIEVNKHDILEVRLGNNSDRLRWVIGGYLYHQTNSFQAIVANPNPPGGYIFTSTRASQELNSKSLFGEATFSITDRLRVIGGLRYTDETLQGLSQADRTEPFDFPLADSVIPRTNFTSTNFKVGVEFDVAPASMLFATYATGFKGGGAYIVSSPVADPARPYQPERVHAVTLGSRNRFFNNALQVNVEGFYWRYYDQQASFVGLDYDGATGLLTKNVGDATIYGANIDLVLRASQNDTIRAQVEYTHSKYDRFSFLASAPYTGGSLCQSIPGPDNVAPVGPDNYTVDCSGLPLTRAPRWSGSVAYDHRFDLANGGNVLATGSMEFATSRYLAVDYTPDVKADGYATFNAEIAYNSPGNGWSIGAYIRNITDEAVYTGASRFSTTQTPRRFSAVIAPPRTFGIRARYNF